MSGPYIDIFTNSTLILALVSSNPYIYEIIAIQGFRAPENPTRNLGFGQVRNCVSNEF